MMSLLNLSHPFYNAKRHHSEYLMGRKGIKVSKIIGGQSKAKIVEWKTRKNARGTRCIDVEVGTSPPPRQMSRQDSVRMEVDVHEEIVHEMHPPMDVDETI
jgi:hypothetical protein